jgi:hypothetical protein
MNERIVWLAAADARGHLMRAHLVRTALARRGVAVDILTTSEHGRAFLRALGSPSALLSSRYAIAFDDRQNMSRARTHANILRYTLRGLRRDLEVLERRAAHADLIVNDFHPALLVGDVGAPVVHVHGTHLWRAIARHFEGSALDRPFEAALHALRARSLGIVEHTLEERRDDGDHRFVPPIVSVPMRSRDEVRAALGVRPGQRLCAIYLNPHFRDPALATARERSLEGFVTHAVGEGYRARRGWRAYDPAFVDVAAAADLLVSAPGMGALAMAHVLDRPLVALVSDQPEQRANLAFLRGRPHALVSINAPIDDVERGVARARELACAPVIDGRARAMRVVDRWVEVFTTLLERAGKRGTRGGRTDDRARARDEQLARR